jgi:uncharacterized membrane protein YozB (DUF420 family)
LVWKDLLTPSILADANLLIQMTAIALLLGAYKYAREARIGHHRILVTFGALLVAVGFFSYMLESFLSVFGTLVTEPFVPVNFLAIVHVSIGTLASIIAAYLAIRMWFFPPTNVGVNRRVMQAMFVLWFVAAGLGVIIYGILYTTLLP